MYNNELYHFGVKGMKWGVRRYQNADGTLTEAGKKRMVKKLKREYRRGYDRAQPYLTSDSYDKRIRDSIGKIITEDDKKRIIEAKNEWLKKYKEASEAEDALYQLAEKYGKKYYDSEMRRDPSLYTTVREKTKLEEMATFEYGIEEARKSRPDLDKASKASDTYWDTYIEECRKVSDKILGEYGNTKLYSDKYGQSLSIRDTVGGVVSSMETDWKK